MSTIHLPRNLRRCLPGKPDADTAVWLTVLGAAFAFDIGLVVLITRIAGV